MALRAGPVRRFLSTSNFPAQFTAATSASVYASAADSDPIGAKAAAKPNTTLFVSGLNKRTTAETLYDAFSEFGKVATAKIVTDRASGFSKGFGFVRYTTLEDAEKGMKGMDGKFIDGWVTFTEYARPRGTPGQ